MLKFIRNVKVPLIFAAVLTFISMLAGHLTFLFDAGVFTYIHMFLNKAFVFFIPLLAIWCALFYPCTGKNKKIAAFFSLPLIFSAIAMIYHLPYRYESMVVTFGYSSGDAVIIALFYSALAFIEIYIHAISLGGVTVLLSRLICRRPCCEIFIKSEKESIFNLAAPRVLAALTASAFAFILALIAEIIDTASFFAESFDTISLAEGLTVVASYLILVVFLVLAHPLLVYFSTENENKI